MKEEKTAVKTAGKENEPVIESTTKKKTKEEKPPTKVVIRRLPPSMTEDQFKVQVSPMPDYDYFYFVPADMSLMPNAFSRAYINFTDQNDLFIFTQKFDGYVFVDSKGGEFPAVVEFAPFQRIPKNRPNRKKDSKVGTIEADPIYIAFKERIEAENLENKTAVNTSKQHFFETSALDKKEEVNNTPLLDYIRNKRAERQRIREEKREEKRKKDLERRRAKEEQRRVKKEDDTSVVKVLNSSQALNKERSKDKEVKSSFIKKKPDDGKTTTKDKFSTEAKLKEGKRTGKSYLEERQRLAERREEQRKKLSQDQSNGATKSILALDEGGGTAAEEVKPGEDATMPATESKGKETESKKPERVFKREERRNSYKYESKRDRDDDPRRSRRGTERSYQNNKRDDERSEDGGRKKYSDSRRGHDTSQRDRYKDKEKNKGFSQRKNETVRETEKRVISGKESADKPSTSETSLKKDSEMLVEKKTENSTEKLDCNTDIKENPPKSDKIELGNKSKMFDSTQPIRRKSMDYDQTKSSLSYSKSNSKDKYYEKRRNSIGSNKNTVLNVENEKEEFQNKTSGKESPLPITSKENQIKSSEIEIKSAREREIRKEFEDEQREIPKRRNSTGGQEAEKMSSRRNSLGSEDKNKVSDVKEPKVVGEVTLEGEKSKSCHEGQNVRDPRTERRIRNKDRPSLEIYRPGMGRFSKQRFEREKEKGLGSSTEMDSPSPSPSPTPQLKHKSTTPH